MDTLTSGLMIDHASGAAVWDFIVELARGADLAIMPGGGPAAVTTAAARSDLPPGLADDAVVITSGSELLRLIEAT